MERIDSQRFMLRMCSSALYHSSSDVFALLLLPVTSRRECSQCSLLRWACVCQTTVFFLSALHVVLSFVFASCFSPGLYFSPDFPSFQKNMHLVFIVSESGFQFFLSFLHQGQLHKLEQRSQLFYISLFDINISILCYNGTSK